MDSVIRAIEVFLPAGILSNEDLAVPGEGWTAAKIEEKTGIRERRIADKDECASDLATHAGRCLFGRGVCRPEDIDFLILCTQTPDYLLPTTACLVQHQLGLSQRCGAVDINLGCSGYIYGLALAKGLIESGSATNVLLITSDTYSKLIHPGDRSVRTLFGDGATATLLQARSGAGLSLGPFVFGTDGSGASHLVLPTRGMRRPFEPSAEATVDEGGSTRTINHLCMKGPEIFSFALNVVPDTVRELLKKAGIRMEDVDLFAFHQANRYMLEHLRRKLGIPPERFLISMAKSGNTVSSTIPMALRDAEDRGALKPGHLVMMVGFGVGLSWGGMCCRWA